MSDITLLRNFNGGGTFKVTEEVYEGFKRISGDCNPLHTDEAFAQGKGFAQRVMYGNILNCFLSAMVGEMLPTKNVIIHSQDIQYKQPVFLGDELTGEIKTEEIYESVQAVELKFAFRNQVGKVVSKGHVQIGILP